MNYLIGEGIHENMQESEGWHWCVTAWNFGREIFFEKFGTEGWHGKF